MSKTVGDVLREYFPEATDDFIEYILWEQTGYPVFWSIPEDGNTPEECLRKQLQEFKDSLRQEMPKEHLPSINEFIGSDPNFTGDMTTEEYIRDMRE